MVDKLISLSGMASVMEERKDRMARLYGDRGIKLRDVENELFIQKRLLTAKDEEIARLKSRVECAEGDFSVLEGMYKDERAKASKLNSEKRKLMELMREPNEKIKRKYSTGTFFVCEKDVLTEYNAYLKDQAKKRKGGGK